MKTLCYALIFSAFTASAQLAVLVSPPKIVGQKALVQLAMKNNFQQSVESARAICFLMDEHGKMIGESTQWVIGENKLALQPSATNTFNFVITSRGGPFTTTNLTANVTFNRVVLENGKAADPKSDVNIEKPKNN